MLKTHYLLRKPKTKGRKAIYFTVRYQNQTAILYPNLSVHSNDWINKKGISKPRDIPENYDLKDQLYSYEKLIRETHIELQKLTPGIKVPADLLKKAVYSKKLTAEVEKVTKVEKEKSIFITDFFQSMIDDSKGKKRLDKSGKIITAGTIQTYETSKNHFSDFQNLKKRKYSLKDINQNLIDGFSDYLNLQLKMAFNTSGKYMKTFRTMLNYARSKKLVSLDVIMDNKVTVTKETTDNIYLTESEIEKIFKLENLDTPLHEVIRDYFVMGCKTGLRFSDLSVLGDAYFDNSYIRSNQIKVSERVTIPIHPIVAQILAKYPNGLPKCPSNQVFNRCLKDIGQKLPELDKDFQKIITRSREPDPKTYKKWELLTAHSSRRSFCTNEYLEGTPTITIMAISGHKSEKAFMTYIKADALQHAKLLGDRWKLRDNDKNDQAA